MSDNKKYYYLKIKETFFDDDKIKIIESMDNGIYYSNLLMKLYLKSLKNNGALRFSKTIPYNEKMISTITNLNIDIVRVGLKILTELEFIEKLDDGTLYMTEIQNFIGSSSTEADRKRKYRNEIDKVKNTLGTNVGQMSQIDRTNVPKMRDKNPPEKELELEKKKELEKEKENNVFLSEKNCIKSDYDIQLEWFNTVWDKYPRKEGKSKITRSKSKLKELYKNKEEVETAIMNYKEKVKNSDSKFIKHGSTFFNGDWQDYIIDTSQTKDKEYYERMYGKGVLDDD